MSIVTALWHCTICNSEYPLESVEEITALRAELATMTAERDRMKAALESLQAHDASVNVQLTIECDRLKTRNAELTIELIRMIDTFSGMSSAMPGPAFGSGAIAKARAALNIL